MPNDEKNNNIISTIDMTTAKKQFVYFLVKGYAPVKWLLKYLCATSAIRIIDYGKSFPQFYAAFTKRLDTLDIFVSALRQAALQFCINIAMEDSSAIKALAMDIKQRIKGFNQFMTQNILALANNATNNARNCWLKMEATCMLTRELEIKGKKVTSMDAPQFKLIFHQFQTTNTMMKLRSVHTMAKDLIDLDRRLRRRVAKSGQYPEKDYYNMYTQNANKWHAQTYDAIDTNRPHVHTYYNQKFQYPGRTRERKERKQQNNDKPSNKENTTRKTDTINITTNNTSRIPIRNRSTNTSTTRSRSRSRSRDINDIRKEKTIPDFVEGYDSQWQQKRALYEYRNGYYFGNAKLESQICRYFKDTGKTCTFGTKRCKWHHMCTFCYIIGQHNADKCPSTAQIIM